MVFFSPQARLFQFPGVKLKYIPLKRIGLLIIPIKMLFASVTKATLWTHHGKYLW